MTLVRVHFCRHRQVDQHVAHQAPLLHVAPAAELLLHRAGGRQGLVGGAARQDPEVPQAAMSETVEAHVYHDLHCASLDCPYMLS